MGGSVAGGFASPLGADVAGGSAKKTGGGTGPFGSVACCDQAAFVAAKQDNTIDKIWVLMRNLYIGISSSYGQTWEGVAEAPSKGSSSQDS
jgi:hypothetical protein